MAVTEDSFHLMRWVLVMVGNAEYELLKEESESTFPFRICFNGGGNHSEKYFLAYIAHNTAHRPSLENIGKDALRILMSASSLSSCGATCHPWDWRTGWCCLMVSLWFLEVGWPLYLRMAKNKRGRAILSKVCQVFFKYPDSIQETASNMFYIMLESKSSLSPETVVGSHKWKSRCLLIAVTCSGASSLLNYVKSSHKSPFRQEKNIVWSKHR